MLSFTVIFFKQMPVIHLLQKDNEVVANQVADPTKKFLTSQPVHLHGKGMIRANASGPSNTHYAYSLYFKHLIRPVVLVT